MSNFLKTIDLYGTNEFFNIKNNSRFKSVWGGFMTIMMVCMSLATSAYYLTVLVDKTSPQIFYQLYKGFNNKTHFNEEDVNQGMFPIFIKMSYVDGSPLDFTKMETDLFFAKNTDLSLIFHLVGQKCNLKNFPKIYQEYLTKQNLIPLNSKKTDFEYDLKTEKFYCFNTTGQNISDFYNSDLGNFYLYSSYNEKNTTQLKLEKEIVMQLYTFYSDYDLENYENVFFNYVKYLGQLAVSPNKMATYRQPFKKVIIDTDIGWIVSEIKKENSFMLGDNIPLESYDNELGSYIIRCEFGLDEYAQYYKRTYMKIQECLSLIGGLQTQINTLFMTFLLFLSKVKLKQELMNEIFEFPCNESHQNLARAFTSRKTSEFNIPKEQDLESGQKHKKEDSRSHSNNYNLDAPKIVIEYKLTDLKEKDISHVKTESAKINSDYKNLKIQKSPTKKAISIEEAPNTSFYRLSISFIDGIKLMILPGCMKSNRSKQKREIFEDLDKIISQFLDVSEMLHFFININKLHHINHYDKIESNFKSKFTYTPNNNIDDYIKDSLVI